MKTKSPLSQTFFYLLAPVYQDDNIPLPQDNTHNQL